VASVRWQIKVVHVGDLYGKKQKKQMMQSDEISWEKREKRGKSNPYR
jgi:hypothetical protein